MKLTFLSLCVFFLSISVSSAQNKVIPCISDEIIANEIKNDPALAERIEQHEAKLYQNVHVANKKAGEGCEVRVIPCVFHIIHFDDGRKDHGNITDETVQKYVDQTNEVFRNRYLDMEDLDEKWHDRVVDMQVELRLAQIDDKGEPTNGIVRVEDESTLEAYDDVKSLSQWDPYKYLNIWIVEDIDYPGAPSGRILGYARFPSWESVNRERSGIVMVSDAIDYGETLPHELGHYLDLYHPFQNGCPQSWENCLTSGDRVCDTPPETSQPEQGCPYKKNSCTSDVPDEYDMMENIMNYTSCRSILTQGQKERVDFTLNGHRAQLISINNLLATGVIESSEEVGNPIAEFGAESFSICEGDVIEFEDLSCTDINKTEYKWIFPSGQPSAAFVRNPVVTYNNPGVYDVSLMITNLSGSDTMIKKGSVRVSPKVSEIKAPLSEGFEESNLPSDGWSFTTISETPWEKTSEVSNGGKSCLHIKNYDTRNAETEYTFRTPPIDLTTSKVFELNFDLAYAVRSTPSRELLQISAIDECNNASYLRYSKTGNGFKSVDDPVTTEFVPNEGDWDNVNIDLSVLKSLRSVSIEFKFIAYGEQNIYIDNIMLGSWPLTVSAIHHREVKVFPNPTQGLLTIEGLEDLDVERIILRDLSGRTVNVKENETKSSTLNLDLNGIQRGVYLLEIKTSTGNQTHRIVKD